MAASTYPAKNWKNFNNGDSNYKELQVCPDKLVEMVLHNLSSMFCLAFENPESCKKAVSRKSIISPKLPKCNAQSLNPDEYLLSIYDVLLNLKMKNDNVLNILNKIAYIGFHFNNLRSIHILLYYLGKVPSVETYVVGKYELFKIIRADVLRNIDEFTIENYLTYRILIKPIFDSFCISMATRTLRKNGIAKAYEEIVQWPAFTFNAPFRKWLCRRICVHYISFNTFDLDIEKYKTILTQGIENTKWPNLLYSMILYDQKLYIEAYNFKDVVDFNNIDEIEALFIAKCLCMLNQWFTAEKLLTRVLTMLDKTYYTNELQKFLFLSYAKQKKWANAIKAGREIKPVEGLDYYEAYVLAKCYMENGENPKDLVIYLKHSKYYQKLEALALLKSKMFYEVIYLLKKDTIDPEECLYLAISYWKLEEYDTCYLYLIRGTINDPSSSDIYYHMGLFYQNVKQNVEMTRTCLEKAHRLNISDFDIIKSLSDFYKKRGLKTENFMFLRRVSQYVTDQSWIYYSIAVHYLRCEQWESAIKFLLKAINCNNEDADAYESLAEVYFSLGYINSSLECFFKLLHLNPQKHMYFITRIGQIYNLLKRFDDAIITFEQVLDFEPRNFMAIIGITECWMKIANLQLGSKIYHYARSAAQTAINYIITTLNSTKNVIPLWKLLGQAILFITILPDDYCFVEIRFHRNVEMGNLGTLYIKSNMYKLVYYCFWRARSILPLQLERIIACTIADEIFEEEESADLFRYCCPTDLGMGYREWVSCILNEPSNFSEV